MPARKKQVWVVMANDYPDAVFSTEAAAQGYSDHEGERNKQVSYALGRGRIYYRSYPFVVDAQLKQEGK